MRMDMAKKGALPALGLFFLAPLVAEFLLGNLPIQLLPALVLLAPLYGGGALLIRELARRNGRGWPSIFMLALAYGVLEEGFATQSLFNPNYLSLNLHLLQPAWIPGLGMGAWWTVFVLSLHTIWSVSASVALAEGAVPAKATTPWLGRWGLAATACVFGLGVAAMTVLSYRKDHFVASPLQFGSAAAVIAVLVAAALLPRRGERQTGPSAAPSPWAAGVLALIAGSAILVTPSPWGWWAVLLLLAVELAGGCAVVLWSRRSGWGGLHKLALAGGAALAYAWHSFIEVPVAVGGRVAARVGNALFTLAVIGLIAWAAARNSQSSGKAMD